MFFSEQDMHGHKSYISMVKIIAATSINFDKCLLYKKNDYIIFFLNIHYYFRDFNGGSEQNLFILNIFLN